MVKSVALDEDDDLDAYMNQIEEKVIDENCLSLQQQVDALKNELQRIEKLLNIAAPKFNQRKNTEKLIAIESPKPVSPKREVEFKRENPVFPEKSAEKPPTKISNEIPNVVAQKSDDGKLPEKVFKGPSKEEMELNVMLQKEEEDVLDFLPPDELEAKDMEKLKHSYGY